MLKILINYLANFLSNLLFFVYDFFIFNYNKYFLKLLIKILLLYK